MISPYELLDELYTVPPKPPIKPSRSEMCLAIAEHDAQTLSIETLREYYVDEMSRWHDEYSKQSTIEAKYDRLVVGRAPS